MGIELQFEIGKTYRVHCARKGKFSLLVKRLSPDVDRWTKASTTDGWITGKITAGKADAIKPENRGYVGDEITIRKSLILSAERY